MTKEFLVNILTVPSCTDHEGFLAECIQNWCKAAGVQCKKDGAGNLFLTKGSPPSGQFYPGATAHIDTVHHDQADMADKRLLLTPKIEGDKITMWRYGKSRKWVKRPEGAEAPPGTVETKSGGDDAKRDWVWYTDRRDELMNDGKIPTYDLVETEGLVQTGTGSDDKNAVAIILSIMERVPFMKTALFTGEESSMKGAKAADMSFFDDVSWVFGCDSPGPANRMTKSLMGVGIYGKEFAEKWLEPICRKHGVTDARGESYTDIYVIREKTKLDCCNINNGGYIAHLPEEYALYSEACATENLGLDLIKSIPLDVRHTSELERPQYSFTGGGYGAYGGYSGYSDWWKDRGWRQGGGGSSRFGKWGRRTSADDASGGWLPGMGPKDGKIATLRWKFSSKAKANTYFLKMKRALPWCKTRIEDTEATVTGPYDDMKKAFIEAYNIDNEVSRPASNVDTNMVLQREFRAAVTVDEPPNAGKPKKVATAKPKKEDREDDTCAICLDLQSDDQADYFIDSLRTEGVDVHATLEDDGDLVTVTGRLKDVKQAYAAFYSIVNKASRTQTFSDVEADGGAGEFWDCVEFAKQDETQDEVAAANAADEIEDAEFTMKDDSAFGDDLMSESDEW